MMFRDIVLLRSEGKNLSDKFSVRCEKLCATKTGMHSDLSNNFKALDSVSIKRNARHFSGDVTVNLPAAHGESIILPFKFSRYLLPV